MPVDLFAKAAHRAALSWLRLTVICAAAGAFLSPAVAQASQPEPLPVTEIASGVFVFQGAYQLFTPGNRGAIANIGFIVGSEAVAVIDSGGSVPVGEQLKAAVVARTNLPIRYVINTHMHPDHVFGNAAFTGPGVEFVGHAKLPRALAARAVHYINANKLLLGPEVAQGLRIIPPSLTVEGTLKLDLGGRVLRLTAHPTAHTDNDLTVLDEKTRTLFAGDLVFSVHTPALDGSLRGWLAVIETLKAFEADRVVPGHGPASMPIASAFDSQLRYLRRLEDDIRKSVLSGVPMADAVKTAAESERDRWKLFDDFNARNAAAAYSELEWD